MSEAYFRYIDKIYLKLYFNGKKIIFKRVKAGFILISNVCILYIL